MNIANLPTEKANEPIEEARESQVQQPMEQQLITKNNNKNYTHHHEALNRIQKIGSHKEVLSQPMQGLSHKQKLIWLQKRRSPGLWVQCDDCDRWRYLHNILDSYELSDKWYCRMNPDSKFASCSIPEVPLQVRDEEDLIHSKYSAGSVVWARMPGFPWWPAMVDDCPDTEQFYWLDGFSDIPTQYNVVFFDVDVTRAWISTEQLKPYTTNKHMLKHLFKDRKYIKRLETAMRQANDAIVLPLSVRLAKYSFIGRYKGNICTPKKIDRSILQKYQNRLKRKFNIDFPIESSSDSDDNESINEKAKRTRLTEKNKTTKSNIKPKYLNREIIATNNKKIQDCPMENDSQKENTNSMAVQVSNNNSMGTMCISTDNGTDNIDATFVLGANSENIIETETNTISQERNPSPSFDFN